MTYYVSHPVALVNFTFLDSSITFERFRMQDSDIVKQLLTILTEEKERRDTKRIGKGKGDDGSMVVNVPDTVLSMLGWVLR